ncbi:O-antigen ligase family protein [Terriglobus sp. ADX1]|uniref:O-antigen ligase family protein n=1 Tax=Terriglobus sp. ADX1 TaxID=2794063 RepID=UPI002FE5152F
MILETTSPGALTSIRAIAMYSAVVAGALATILWKSEIGIYLLSVLLPLQTTRYHLHAFPLGSNIVDILILCTLLGSVLRPQAPLLRRTSVLAFLGLMCGFYYLSLWRGAFYLGGSFPVWFSDTRLVDYKNFIVMPLLVVAVTRTIRTRKQIAIIIALCCVTALAVDFSYLRSAAGRDFSHYAEETRDAGPLGYAGENGLASYLVEATAFLLPLLALKGKPLIRAGIVLVVAANTTCILFSYSREAYLALALVLCFLAVVKIRWLFIPILLLVVSWQAILPLAVQERIAMTYTKPDPGQSAALDASAQERVMLWTDAINMFRANPVIGTGFLTYAEMGRVGSYKDTHNFYLKMLVETGLSGLLLFLVQLLLFTRTGLQLFSRARDSFLSLVGLGFACLILTAAIVNFFGDRWMFIQVDSNLWILLGCTLCGISIASAKTSAATEKTVRKTIKRDPWHTANPPLIHGDAAV